MHAHRALLDVRIAGVASRPEGPERWQIRPQRESVSREGRERAARGAGERRTGPDGSLKPRLGAVRMARDPAGSIRPAPRPFYQQKHGNGGLVVSIRKAQRSRVQGQTSRERRWGRRSSVAAESMELGRIRRAESSAENEPERQRDDVRDGAEHHQDGEQDGRRNWTGSSVLMPARQACPFAQTQRRPRHRWDHLSSTKAATTWMPERPPPRC